MRKLNAWQVNDFLRKYASDKSQKVLDLGSGEVSKHRALFPNLVTLDAEAVKKPDIVGDIHNLPLPDGSFDIIVCSEVYEHIQDPVRATSELKRVLKPGGLLLLTTDFIFPVHDAPGDYYRYTPYALKELFKDWEIVESAVESDVFSTVGILLQRIMFQTRLRGGKLTKSVIYLFALFFSKLDFLVLERYGDVKRTSKVDILLASGVFIACRKK